MSDHLELSGQDLHEPTNKKVLNKSGAKLTTLKVLKWVGSESNIPKVAPLTSQSDIVAGIVAKYTVNNVIVDGIENDQIGFIRQLGFLLNVDTSAWTLNQILYVDNNGDLVTTVTQLKVAQVLFVDPLLGVLYFTNQGLQGEKGNDGDLTIVGLGDLDTDFTDLNRLMVGSTLDTGEGSIDVVAGEVVLSVEKVGGGNIRGVFNVGIVELITTPPATVVLIPGTISLPKENYVYVEAGTYDLLVNTTGFPDEEHIPVARITVPSVAEVDNFGVYKSWAWVNHVYEELKNGHFSHVNDWIRRQPATYISGIDQTYTITTNAGIPDDVIFTCLSGIIKQMHTNLAPAFTGTPDIRVINDPVTPYRRITNLNELLVDSLGASMEGRRFSLVIIEVVSSIIGDSKLYVKLPSGSYNSDSGVIADSSNYADRSMPANFVGTGILVSEWKLRHQNQNSGTWTSVKEVDLRSPSTSGGGVSGDQKWSGNVIGGNSTVGAGTIKNISYGHSNSVGLIPMAEDGEVISVAIGMSVARTAGVCEGRILINGVAQTGVGETVLIDATNTLANFVKLASPISYLAGDTIGGQTSTTGFAPTGSDAAMKIDVRSI